MDDLSGPAQQRLNLLDLVAVDDLTIDWLRRQLRQALGELYILEPVADDERERREDY